MCTSGNNATVPFREALVDKGITPCIPGRKSRDKPIKYDKRRYKRRNRIEIMFGRLKDWRRVASRYDRNYAGKNGKQGAKLEAAMKRSNASENEGARNRSD